MIRAGILLLAPLLLAAVVAAQSTATPEELIERLGHEDYAVREQATSDLIGLGEKALPALERALNSDDLEVRRRAGRAIRAIRADEGKRKAGKKVEESKPRARANVSRGIEIVIGPDGRVKVKQRVVEDGEETVKEYEGESLEALKRKHPELREALGDTRFGFRFGSDRKELEKLFEEFRGFQGLEREFFDREFWKELDDEWRDQLQRLERWRSRAREQQKRALDAWRRSRPVPDGKLLGVRAVTPGEVLNAHLNLRGSGLVVETIEEGSIAADLGMQRYDVIVRLNGFDIKKPQDVRLALADYERGGGPQGEAPRARVRAIGFTTESRSTQRRTELKKAGVLACGQSSPVRLCGK